MSKIKYYVISDASVTDVPKWSMVAQTECLEDGTWVTGDILITSIEDVLDRAEKAGKPIIFESMLTKKEEK